METIFKVNQRVWIEFQNQQFKPNSGIFTVLDICDTFMLASSLESINGKHLSRNKIGMEYVDEFGIKTMRYAYPYRIYFNNILNYKILIDC